MLKDLACALLLFCCWGGIYSKASADAPVPSTISRVTSVLDKYTFKNLCFDFSIVESRKSKGQDHLSITGWSSGRMYVNGMPDSLVKVIYAPSTLHWIDGPAPYYQENKTIAYNGKYWISSITDRGAINAMTRYLTADITEKCPNTWDPVGWETGEIFLVTHAQVVNKLTVGEVLKQHIELPFPFFRSNYIRVVEDENMFKIYIGQSISSPSGTEVWLDMQKGGALKKIISKGQILTEEVTVDSFQEVGGIWFPTKGTRISKIDGDKNVTKLEFSASNFSLIDKAEGLYDVKLDPGCHVQDMRSHTSYVVGGESK